MISSSSGKPASTLSISKRVSRQRANERRRHERSAEDFSASRTCVFLSRAVLAWLLATPLDCEQSLSFLCKVTARRNLSTRVAKPRAASREKRGREPARRKNKSFLVWSQSLIEIITWWFAIALDEIRTRRILREKADCKQSTTPPNGELARWLSSGRWLISVLCVLSGALVLFILQLITKISGN